MIIRPNYITKSNNKYKLKLNKLPRACVLVSIQSWTITAIIQHSFLVLNQFFHLMCLLTSLVHTKIGLEIRVYFKHKASTINSYLINDNFNNKNNKKYRLLLFGLAQMTVHHHFLRDMHTKYELFYKHKTSTMV